MTPSTLPAEMRAHDPDAVAGLIAAARALSLATSGKVAREAMPQPVRTALAGIDGALSRLGAAPVLRDRGRREGRG